MDSKPSTCERCGLEWPWLERHHTVPQSQGGSDSPTLWVCQNCHEDLQGPMGRDIAFTPEARKRISEGWKRWYYGDPGNREQRAELTRLSHARGERQHIPEVIAAWHRDNPDANAARIEKIKTAKAARMAGDPPKRAGADWHSGNPRCTSCGRTDRPPKAHGLCNACYLRTYRREKRTHGSM